MEPAILQEIRECFGTDDLYAVLGVDDEQQKKTMTTTQIKKAFYRQSLKWHPDKIDASSRWFTRGFQLLLGVYQHLSDDRTRRIYDRSRLQSEEEVEEDEEEEEGEEDEEEEETVAPAGGVFKCAHCDQVAFTSARLLAAHDQRWHGDRPASWRHQCPECGVPFQCKTHLDNHVRVHTGQKPYKCPQCDKAFSEKGSLTRHSRIHTGQQPFTCPVCQKKFNQKCNMDKHARIHSGETPFCCQHCARPFTDPSHCIWHEKNQCPNRPDID